jgi:uncharacterized protein DUF4157
VYACSECAHATKRPPARRCSCGGLIRAGGECEACRRRREGRRLARPGGVQLEPAVRDRFERALGHDFSAVRVHTDGASTASAHAAGALAYTVGADIVFGHGQYAPTRRSGAELLAHELVHVVQQGAATQQRGQPSAPPTALAAARDGSNSSDPFEQEANRIAAQVGANQSSARPTLRRSRGLQAQSAPHLTLRPEFQAPPLILPGQIPEAIVVPEPPAPPQLDLSLLEGRGRHAQQPHAPVLVGPRPFTPVAIIPLPRCIPDRPLTWADFPGGAPPSGFAAQTRVQPIPTTVQGNPMVQLWLQRTSSVRAKYRNPGSRATNGCAPLLAQCRQFFSHGRTGTWSFTAPPPSPHPCPATILPSTTLQATSAGECDSVLGPECDQAAQAESARLLHHEQLHFDIGCVLVKKGDDALRSGSAQLPAVSAAIGQKLQPLQDSYDHDSDHGCDAGGQATWDTNVSGGLANVTIP